MGQSFEENAKEAAVRTRPTVLMVAYHFPPFVGSSGVHRTLKFCRYLRDYGWQPVILTVQPHAYVKQSTQELDQVPDDVPVYRSFCLDAARHLAVAGKHSDLLALPDRWVSWWPSGTLAGGRAIRDWAPDVIWSTYPVATAHLIGGTLSKLHRLPWVADFRDWMTENDYPAGRLRRTLYRRIERHVLETSDAAVFTTDASRELYRQRYPDLAEAPWTVLPNGYDEADFTDSSCNPAPSSARLTLLHSGHLYAGDRSPTALLEALALLRDRGHRESRRLDVVFRAPADSGFAESEALRLGVADQVRTEPLVTQREAIREMRAADALVLIQGPRFRRQVPAKAYEYLRAGRPVLTLAPDDSESCRLMADMGFPYQADMGDAAGIAASLERLLSDIAGGHAYTACPARVASFSRRAQAETLSGILSAVSNRKPVRTSNRRRPLGAQGYATGR